MIRRLSFLERKPRAGTHNGRRDTSAFGVAIQEIESGLLLTSNRRNRLPWNVLGGKVRQRRAGIRLVPVVHFDVCFVLCSIEYS